jgi:predicted metal-dependent phosphoesterase TrpH
MTTAPVPPRPRHAAASPIPKSTLNIEFHCHTIASMDGVIPFDALLNTAIQVSLDAIAITDHDTLEGAVELQRRARERRAPVQIIVGEEKTLADGTHLIGLFLKQAIHSGDLAGAIREIEEQGGLCLIPHPFRSKDGLFRDGLDRLELFAGRVAGFEFFSAKSSHEENRRAAALLAQTHLAPFGGSDAHYECDLGECVNEIANAGDLRTSVQAMFERRAPFRILGKPQGDGDGERTYAPLYYRVKRFAHLPKFLVPAARQCYRRYRNLKFGVGPKLLREVYRHA